MHWPRLRRTRHLRGETMPWGCIRAVAPKQVARRSQLAPRAANPRPLPTTMATPTTIAQLLRPRHSMTPPHPFWTRRRQEIESMPGRCVGRFEGPLLSKGGACRPPWTAYMTEWNHWGRRARSRNRHIFHDAVDWALIGGRGHPLRIRSITCEFCDNS
jgi:hypothetical protein